MDGTPQTARMPAPAVFLGALASEVNEPDALAPPFAALADAAERVVAAVRAGHVRAEDGAGYLSALRLTDANDVTWTLGATSLRWYRKSPGRAWKLAAPPPVTDDVAAASAQAAIATIPREIVADPDAPVLGYGIDPSDVTLGGAPRPWEYEPGDDRRLAPLGDVYPL